MKLFPSRFIIGIRFLSRIPRWIGEHPFLGFLALLFAALLISSGVFYQYVLRPADIPEEAAQVRFDNQSFQRVISTWQELEEKFEQANSLKPKDIFAPRRAADD